MAGKDIISFGAAVAGDVMSVFIPGAGTVGKVVDSYLDRKQAEVHEILLEELSKGGFHGEIKFDEHDADPLLEVTFRLSKAVAAGAARDNLRLLAQIIAGLKKNKALANDAFQKWSGILESLTRDELMVIGNAAIAQRTVEASEEEPKPPFFKVLEEAMTAGNYQRPEFMALCASVSRTGLLLPASAWGGLVYSPSPWLGELATLADVESLASRP